MSYKTVRYLGKSHQVPEQASFICASMAGDVFAFEKQPHWDGRHLVVDNGGEHWYVGSAHCPPVQKI